MEMHYVDSSNLECVGYEESTRTLVVEFKKSGTYQFFDVSETVFKELLHANSPGSYFNENIKRVFSFSKI
ncbi:KTSC domain-containing protein [Oxalobacteraceae bacterium CAVE-383]|nr:KTSC domain-containing protein [Oxalobacteraceae bacterium CAVE-383]